MARSNRLTLGEVRQTLRLVGECRDLGRDTQGWILHAMAGTQRLLGAKVVLGGLASPEGFHLASEVPLLLSAGWDSPAQETEAMTYLMTDPHLHDPAFQAYRQLGTPNITLRPSRLVPHKAVALSEYHARRRGFGIADMMFSQRQAPGGSSSFSLAPQRAAGDRDFSARDAKLLRLLHEELTLLLGSVLWDGQVDPLAGLSPRLRQTLALLLDGSSEKAVALCLGISRHTVHEYVRAVYRHFQVTSRPELLVSCRKTGIGGLWPPGSMPDAKSSQEVVARTELMRPGSAAATGE